MGSWFDLHVDGPDAAGDIAALVVARAQVEGLEQVFSRFRESSELSALNREGGGPVGRDMARVIRLSMRMRDVTHGWFDPTVGEAVRAAGYDRPFDTIPTDRPDESAPTTTRPLLVGPGEIEIVGSTVTLRNVRTARELAAMVAARGA